MSVDRISFMLIMRDVFRDGNTIDLSKLDINPPAGSKVSSHNIHYSPHETKFVNY
jgi:hypothetical protein